MPRELLVAELAPGPPLRTRVLQVVFHEDAWYLCPAVARAGDGIVLARVEVPLEETRQSVIEVQVEILGFSHVFLKYTPHKTLHTPLAPVAR